MGNNLTAKYRWALEGRLADFNETLLRIIFFFPLLSKETLLIAAGLKSLEWELQTGVFSL